MPTIDFSVYLITDRTLTAGRELSTVIAEALRGGIRAVQLREKDLQDRDLFNMALGLRRLTREYGARLLINSRVDIALAVNADGVHLGQTSLPVTEARRLVGPQRLIAYSAHSLDEALQAEKDGADFITFGPVFHTPSKAAYGAPVGIEKLAGVSQSLAIPVFALGGINRDSINAVRTTGVHGIALISAIIAAEKPSEAAHLLIETFGNHACHS